MRAKGEPPDSAKKGSYASARLHFAERKRKRPLLGLRFWQSDKDSMLIFAKKIMSAQKLPLLFLH